MEDILGPAIIVGVCVFFAWALWATRPEHPERLAWVRPDQPRRE